MKLPRDISGIDLLKLLSQFGYTLVKQTGSHMKLGTKLHGEHHITIPAHDPIKVGTLSAILTDVSKHLDMSKDALMEQIFR